MASLVTIVGVILVFLILISPIVAIVLEEVFSRSKKKDNAA